MTHRQDEGIVRAGGVALLAAALGFTAVFLYLAVRFNYPDVLDAPAAQALPGGPSLGEDRSMSQAAARSRARRRSIQAAAAASAM